MFIIYTWDQSFLIWDQTDEIFHYFESVYFTDYSYNTFLYKYSYISAFNTWKRQYGNYSWILITNDGLKTFGFNSFLCYTTHTFKLNWLELLKS